ncbi:MAG: class II aldolase/adducin family protein [Cyanobacteria bacterium P01_F01_bin.53]
MIDEGYIKYRCDWNNTDAIKPASVMALTRYRNALHQLNFIGEYPGGIGFGNISQRLSPGPQFPQTPNPRITAPPPHPRRLNVAADQFIITGTQTGNLTTLTAADYALVTSFNPGQNSLTCQGLRKASSESLTHGVIYASHPAIGAIIHIHSPQLWKQLLGQVPTTRAEVPYGTPEMAAETQRLFAERDLAQLKIFAMAGHEDGIVTFGENLQIAYRVLINWCLMTGFMTQLDSAAALQLPH